MLTYLFVQSRAMFQIFPDDIMLRGLDAKHRSDRGLLNEPRLLIERCAVGGSIWCLVLVCSVGMSLEWNWRGVFIFEGLMQQESKRKQKSPEPRRKQKSMQTTKNGTVSVRTMRL